MAKSKGELIYDIENELVDPTTNKITGERVKARLLDMVDAMGTGGGGSQYKYYSIDEGSNATEFAFGIGSVVKAAVPSGEQSQIIIISPLSAGTDAEIIAVAIDMSLRIVFNGIEVTYGQYIEEVLALMEVESLDEIGAHEITEKEFYTI